jgi:molecular chaperone HscC
MPLVRKLVSRMFSRFPALHLNPDETIALGAAIQAGLKMRDAALEEIVMTDVAPYSMGISIALQISPTQYDPGHYLPIIERNSTVPISRTKSITTIRDFQKELTVQIFQGESRLVKDNVYLGRIEFPVPAKKSGEVSIDIRFTYDVSGVLEAEAHIQETGQVHKLIIAENPGVMNPAQIEQRMIELAELKIHPRDQMENRTLIALADRLYEQSLGEIRSFLAQQIGTFQATLETQDPEQVREARQHFKKILQHIEQESFL